MMVDRHAIIDALLGLLGTLDEQYAEEPVAREALDEVRRWALDQRVVVVADKYML